MKNYFVFCIHSKKTFFEGSLQECYNQLKHVAGFGIANNLGFPIAYRTLSGFTLPERLKNSYPKTYNKLQKLHFWY